jgi:hypothetical protein
MRRPEAGKADPVVRGLDPTATAAGRHRSGGCWTWFSKDRCILNEDLERNGIRRRDRGQRRLEAESANPVVGWPDLMTGEEACRTVDEGAGSRRPWGREQRRRAGELWMSCGERG